MCCDWFSEHRNEEIKGVENLFLKLVFKSGYPFKGRIGRALTAKFPKGGDIY